VKRSKSIRLLLMGGVAAGALTGCGPGTASVSSQNVYTNNYYVPGVGYYHAPFRAWYALPYNHFDPQNQRYFYGGQWALSPHQTVTNISSPAPEVARQAEAQRTDIPRGGFGRTSHHSHIYS
jgi:hypothetical protein